MTGHSILVIGIRPSCGVAVYTITFEGPSRGIGLHFLKVFSEKGWKIFGTLEKTGAKIFDLDYLDEQSITDTAKAYGEERSLEVLINCAGIEVYLATWKETTAEHMINKYRLMTVGPFIATKIFLPALKKSEADKVINITSFWASLAGMCDTNGKAGSSAQKFNLIMEENAFRQ